MVARIEMGKKNKKKTGTRTLYVIMYDNLVQYI